MPGRTSCVFSESRRGLLDAVVFSGGEPTLQGGLADAMREAKTMGFRIGLHSAGMYPQRLARVLAAHRLDRPRPEGTARRLSPHHRHPGIGEAVFESLRLILEAGVDHELRCTWHPDLLSGAELSDLADEALAVGTDRLVIQEHRPAGCGARLPEIGAGDRERAGLDALATRFRYFSVRGSP
jgi:pyruvate formate lyase activating enzyme